MTLNTKGLLTQLRIMAHEMGYDKKFDDYVRQKPRHAAADLVYFLAWDLDFEKFVMETDHTITHNTIVMKRAMLPSKKEKNGQPQIEEYIFEWEKSKSNE